MLKFTHNPLKPDENIKHIGNNLRNVVKSISTSDSRAEMYHPFNCSGEATPYLMELRRNGSDSIVSQALFSWMTGRLTA